MPRPVSAASSRRSWLSSLLVALLWFAAIYAFAVGGCVVQQCYLLLNPGGRITSYTVKKAALLDQEYPARQPIGQPGDRPTGPTETKDRMLAAIVLHGSQAWFFKVTGPLAAVEKEAETFSEFIKSVHFDGADAAPQWELPSGWDQQPGNEMRFATLKVGSGDGALDLSVSSLPKGEGDDAEYLLANVNRWRGQLSLPPLAPSELPKELKEVELTGAQAYLVDFKGSLGSSGMGPFSGGQGPFAGGRDTQTNPGPTNLGPVTSGRLKYKSPESWREVPASGMRKAAFVLMDGDQRAEVTVIDLAAAANDLLTNVNRWRGQVKLAPVTQAELKDTVRDLDLGGVKGQYVELVGPESETRRETILGVVAYVGEKVWFIKLQGDADLAAREKANFEAFVGSIQF